MHDLKYDTPPVRIYLIGGVAIYSIIKNRRMRPDEVYKESTKKVWWKCTQCGYEWFGSIRGRTVNGIGCKKCHRNNPFIL
jgi:hypothetical protein